MTHRLGGWADFLAPCALEDGIDGLRDGIGQRASTLFRFGRNNLGCLSIRPARVRFQARVGCQLRRVSSSSQRGSSGLQKRRVI